MCLVLCGVAEEDEEGRIEQKPIQQKLLHQLHRRLFTILSLQHPIHEPYKLLEQGLSHCYLNTKELLYPLYAVAGLAIVTGKR